MALTKKSLNNFLPNGFETQNKEGYKANFTNDRILSGYEKDTLEILSGPNLNNFIDKTGKNFNTLNDLLEYFNAMPIDSFPIVNASNQLDYKSINSFFRNVGELVFSSVPIDDKNLHLADGSLLDGKGTYRVFVDFIGKMATKYPNLFTDEATWQATVSKYGTCGKYVWNAENKTLRLPRLKGIVEATIDQNSIGNITEAGLPNITGTAHFSQEQEAWNAKDWYDGAFFLKQRKGNGVEGTRGAFDLVGFDASRSSKVYGKSNTVQPQTVKQYIYIVVSVDTEETTKLTSVFQYRGSVPTFEDLPKEGNITGDVWNVDETDVNYVWDGNEWDQLSGSVDLTGYYTKEQADTRFATVTSLESNVENLQSKITQNTTDIASLGLGGLVASSLEKGKALKYLETKGNITEDADVYNDVYNYKHSSFDLSKFTVVGSPTITDDGVASGFSGSNYLTVPNKILQKIGQKPFEIKVKFSNIPMFAGTVSFPSVLGNMASAVENRTNITLSRNNLNPFLFLEANFTDGTHGPIGYITNIPATLTDVEYSLIFDGFTYTVKALANGVELPFVRGSFSSEGKFIDWGTEDLFIGIRSVGASFDLKQFSITVDGKEVFNGNKTGLDVIKEDNYTVVGTPNITDDGIASGFSNGNYISTPVISLAQKNWEIISPTYRFYKESTKNRALLSSKSIAGFHIYYQDKITLDIGDGSFWAGGLGVNIQTNFKPPLNTNIIFKLKFIYKDGYYLYYSLDGINFIQIYKGITTTFLPNMGINVGENRSGVGASLDEGMVDLNSFKIYVDGQLVYQPCLKIPYNISKTGLKVANANARERVIGMGEDYGYSQYFTIDEENKNATLPIGAGITGRQDLIASFDDGTNKYEQFSDLTFKQSGKCTANTAVTFIQPYKDDTYKLSVPYSAKTKTGFTPTVSGDWFAEGKIYLD